MTYLCTSHCFTIGGAVPATIAALLRRADLGLTLLAGSDAPQLSAPIRWVTTSELMDPTPYLRGGELLLTTGMRIKATKIDVAQYVSRLARAGVLGIGIGVGKDLIFRRPPSRLVNAAATHRLPLLLVDEPTPFIAIGEAVAQLHLADETAALAEALRGQQAITRASVREGPTGVVRRLAALTGGWVVVAGADSAVHYEAPVGAATTHPQWRSELARLSEGRVAVAVAGPDGQVTIQALGDRGYLVTGHPDALTTAHHSLINVAAALLAVGLAGGIDAGPDPAAEKGAAIRASLARYQRRSRVRLGESLRAWLAHHGRIEPAAAELGIHRNTLALRVRRARELLHSELGFDLDDPAVRAELWRALSR